MWLHTIVSAFPTCHLPIGHTQPIRKLRVPDLSDSCQNVEFIVKQTITHKPRGGYKTFKKNNIDEKGSMKARLKQPISLSSLGSNVDLAKAVRCPKGEDKEEWWAVHVVDFINSINILYGSVAEYCTKQTCPKMTATKEFEYMWMNKNDKKFVKPTSVSAPAYVELLMDWIEVQVNDPKTFPTDPKVSFPKTFDKTVKDIFKRLFRIYAHIYCSHLDEVKNNGEEAHLNTCFKHFMYFSFEFDMIQKKELEPLKTVIVTLLGDDVKGKLN
jgi:MOB kinase activator 1